MHEGVCNHLSVKAPSLHTKGERPVMLTAPYGIYWTEITPRHLVGKAFAPIFFKLALKINL